MFVVGKCVEVGTVWGIVPTNFQFVSCCEPIVATAHKNSPLPLFREPQVRVVLQVQDEAEGLTIQVERDDSLHQDGETRFNLQESLSGLHQ